MPDRRVELLAPAGDLERLTYVLRYGADAVYLAGTSFGMRAAAGNFDQEGLRQAVALSHDRGVRVYLTCNTIPRNHEMAGLPGFFEYAQEIGVDALIVADMGVFALARRHAPGLPLHISTQAGVMNADSAMAWRDLGARRVILAREMGLDEIEALRARCPRDLELEVFVHGAMCVSFSGRCLLSQYMAGRDANRGACAQPCRWKYHLVEERRPGEFMEISEDGGTHILNARDLCMIDHLPELIDAGVDSIKIEGRMKSFYYAAVVTNAYRKALDAALAGEPLEAVWRREVEKVSHRAYSTGFFHSPEGGGQYTEDALYIRGCDVVAVVESCDGDGRALVTQRNRFFPGETLELLTPEGEPIPFVLDAMADGEGTPIDSAPHPMMPVRLKLPRPAPPYSILRRDVVSDLDGERIEREEDMDRD